jgi:metal-responsive CopG/Arc/MetJ family transcriptional regulator
MKLAVSIPDEIFAEAEAFAKGTQTSRSRLYSIALAEYMARHAPDLVTEAMDNVLAAIGEEDPGFNQRAARRSLERSEW